MNSGTSTTSNGSHQEINVGSIERWAFALGGGALAAYGISKRSPGGMLLTALGAGMLFRGATGHCELYHKLGIHSGSSNQVARDVHIEKSININRSPEELYTFWRDFENLPRFMKYVQSVTVLDNERSHWVVTGPAGEKEEWDAEIYNEKPNELIAWRSLPDSDFINAGTVRFEPTSTGETRVRVVMNYNVPGGNLTAKIARLFARAPEDLIEEDLRRLKQLMETGEIATTEGQPSGREVMNAAAMEHSRKDEPERAMTQTHSAAGGTMIGRAHSQIG
jgi:uncharacterized membrane protein